jgi:hypothetical protein
LAGCRWLRSARLGNKSLNERLVNTPAPVTMRVPRGGMSP